ncbi:hypothetical protein KI387_041966 [Taxus chinensis]|uniref:Retrotransposon gag domain-containing protein n=1 Tax=Taxus chinensis TaxID=29808 RepID=A0AA38C5K8_TAXCH|nr:hypothetical protein KI387_041966 [Taxus chinensis]
MKATTSEISNAYPKILTSEEDKNYNTEQFMTGYHEPAQSNPTPQAPQQGTQSSPNDLISTLVGRIRELESAQTSQPTHAVGQNMGYPVDNKGYIPSNEKPTQYPVQQGYLVHSNPGDLLTGLDTLGMGPHPSQAYPTQGLAGSAFLNAATTGNVTFPGFMPASPYPGTIPPYMHMYSKTPQMDPYAIPTPYMPYQGTPYVPINAYNAAYPTPPPPPPHQGSSMVESYAMGTYTEYLKEPLDFTIRGVMLPRPFPDLPKFKGEGDPNAHIKAYATAIRELLPWDVVVAKIFPNTLKGITLDWYYHIPEASIHSFKQLVSKFIKAFDMNKLLHTGIREFLHIRQEKNESATHFI